MALILMADASKKRDAQFVSRGAVHKALRDARGRASPGATRVLVDALDRIAVQLVRRSEEIARADRRRTVLDRHAHAAFMEFLWPRQGMGRAAQVMRDALAELEVLVRAAPSELPRAEPPEADDADEAET
jgi:histone H3/H4